MGAGRIRKIRQLQKGRFRDLRSVLDRMALPKFSSSEAVKSYAVIAAVSALGDMLVFGGHVALIGTLHD